MIDEKKLLKVLNEWSEHYIKKKDAYSRIKFLMVSRFKSMVSHSPKINKWIPCSERLPEWRTNPYLVCLRNGAVAIAIFLSNGEFKEISSLGTKEFYRDNPVIAWQPLPETYKE